MRGALAVVVTTIQPPTDAMRRLSEHVRRLDGEMIVIGDLRGPTTYDLLGSWFVTYSSQATLPYRLARRLPPNSYARKNLGYLRAINQGARCLYDTDDDNAPSEGWAPRARAVRAECVAGRPWANVYQLFTDDLIWPRGLPLEHVRTSRPVGSGSVREVEAPIQQVLVDVSPDVDATWRLLYEAPFRFIQRASVRLDPGSWCPFNSQATWWWPEAYPLLYLPSYCSARVADIWRSFVAQRCIRELGVGVVFHCPDVEQIRNRHDLLQDFEGEIAGYLRNTEIAQVLDGLELRDGSAAWAVNLRDCYAALIRLGVLPQAELALLEDWIADIEKAAHIGGYQSAGQSHY